MIYLVQPKIHQTIADVIDSARLRVTNHLFGSLQHKIFFAHLHKCGGTSVAKGIRSCYRTLDLTQERRLVSIDAAASLQATLMHHSIEPSWQQDYFGDPHLVHQVLKHREELLLYYMCNDSVQYVSGHFGFSPKIHQYFSERYSFITLLRDPVERVISLYYYNRYHSGAKPGIQDLQSYLKSRGEQNRGYYVRMLGGLAADGDYTSRDAIARAKQNLHKFALIGCLEHLQDFVQKFELKFDHKLRVRTLNKSPRPKAIQEDTENIRAEIRELCAPDVEIYNYVLETFVQSKLTSKT
ncbi:MAG: sulfotransferase family 2 domain-containing protein [Cyanobacteria bacterium P01_A01_bin.17]